MTEYRRRSGVLVVMLNVVVVGVLDSRLRGNDGGVELAGVRRVVATVARMLGDRVAATV